MLKRFVLGFILGLGIMYWYIHDSGRYVGKAHTWMENSASGYRGDKDHVAIERETGQ